MMRHLLATALLLATAALAQSSPFVGKHKILGTPGRTHGSMISFAAFAPDDSMALSAGWDWHAKIWSRSSGKLVTDKQCEAIIGGAVFVVDPAKKGAAGLRVAVLENAKGIRIFRAGNGKDVKFLEGVFKGMGASRDGKLLAVMNDNGELLMLDASGNEQRRVTVGKGFGQIRFSPDGKVVAINNPFGKKLAIVDVATNKLTATVDLPGMVTKYDFAVDGKSVFASVRSGIERLAIPSGESLDQLGLRSRPASLMVRDDKTLLVGTDDGAILEVDLEAKKIGDVCHEHGDSVVGMAMTRDARLLVSCSHDQWVRFWNAQDLSMEKLAKGHNSSVSAVGFAPDGALVSGADDNSLAYWQKNKLAHANRPHEYSVTAVLATADGYWSASYDDKLRRADRSGKEIESISVEGEGASPLCLAATADGTLITGNRDGSVRWYRDGKQQRALAGHEQPVLQVLASTDGKVVVSGDVAGVVIVWDTARHEVARKLTAHEGGVSGLALVADNAFVSSGYDRGLKRWRVDADEPTHAIVVSEEERAAIGGVAFCAPQGLIVTVSADKLRCFAADTLKARGERGELPGVPQSFAASADGTAVAAGLGDGTIAVWKLRPAKGSRKRR